jgi:hypothetical protein
VVHITVLTLVVVKPAPVVFGQLQASALELPAQDTVLLNEIVEYGSVLAVQPAGEDGEQQLERRSVNHGGNLYHGPGFHALLVGRSSRGTLWSRHGKSAPLSISS